MGRYETFESMRVQDTKSKMVVSPLVKGVIDHRSVALIVLARAALVRVHAVVVQAHDADHRVDGALGQRVVLPGLGHDAEGFVEETGGKAATSGKGLYICLPSLSPQKMQ